MIAPPFTRRKFLRSAGALVALPFLEAFAKQDTEVHPYRMVFIMTNMGVMPRYFFPKNTGPDYQTSPYLDLLREHRNRFSVFSGLSHPGVDGNHSSERSFLSCAPRPGSSAFRNTISVDQFVAEQIGPKTRFNSLVLAVGKDHMGTPSTTQDGVQLPAERSPARLYKKMFVEGSPAETERVIEDLRKGGSILDFSSQSAKGLARHLAPMDRERLDQYFTSLRELETRLHHAEAWERKPKPVVSADSPKDITDDAEVEAQTNLMYDMVRLALETDSTRILSLYLGPLLVTPKIPGVKNQTHALTHHGNEEEKIEELRKIEEAQFRSLNRLLSGLHGVQESGSSLLDRTMVLYGSNLSNANAHDTSNLPVLLAGGGFRHGQHLAFNPKNNKPLANLFVSMLQRSGLEIDKFASSSGTLTGLSI